MEYWELSAELAERAYDYKQNIEHYKKHHILNDDYREQVTAMKAKLADMESKHDDIRRRCQNGEKFEWSHLNGL